MKRRTPTPEQKAAAQEKRADLIALSRPIQKARKAGLMPYAQMTVNEALELIYKARTGQREFHTFQGWKAEGFAVEKGSKGFAVWGKPMDAKRPAPEGGEPATADAGEGGEEGGDGHFSWWPIAYLFHAGQVTNAEGARPASYNASAQPAPMAPEEAEPVESAPAPARVLYTFPDAAEPSPATLDATLAA